MHAVATATFGKSRGKPYRLVSQRCERLEQDPPGLVRIGGLGRPERHGGLSRGNLQQARHVTDLPADPPLSRRTTSWRAV